jgi:hypothetical protein
MFEVYSHPRIEAKADAVKLLEGKMKRAETPPPPDLSHPTIQSEI